MLRLLATALAAILAMVALSLSFRGVSAHPGAAVASAPAGAINPWSKDAPPPQRWHFVAAGSRAAPSSARAPDPTTIARDPSGHFRIAGQVNGSDADFIVDTGADLVALTRDEAQRLGIFVAPADFRPMLRTASGVAGGAPVKIDRLSVGGSELHDVDAVVVDGLGVNLLGQSALRRLGRVEEHGDHMVIAPD